MKLQLFVGLAMIGLFFCFIGCGPQTDPQKSIIWKHISSVDGAIEVPNSGAQQTASVVFDVNKDGLNDFLITERSEAPAVVWYQRLADGWQRMVVDTAHLRIEAGSAVTDIDGDGDLDVVFGGDGGCNQVWWWENPWPNYDANTPWIRRTIKNEGPNKHHDQIFGDFDGDGRDELVFWNQSAFTLYLAEIPEDPKNTEAWDYLAIYTYSADIEPPQRGTYPGWKGTNEHEGLAKCDLDGDGKTDIIGGGRWFKHIEGTTFEAHIIDDTYAFSRSAAGQLIKGGRPEVLLVVGDGRAPLNLYQWKNEAWQVKTLIDEVQDGHSLDVLDVDGDGNLDIFLAEMRLGQNPEAKTRIMFGDGTGNFTEHIVSTGFGLHESRIADLDGDGDVDILGKPYAWEAPRLDVWLNLTR